VEEEGQAEMEQEELVHKVVWAVVVAVAGSTLAISAIHQTLAESRGRKIFLGLWRSMDGAISWKAGNIK